MAKNCEKCPIGRSGDPCVDVPKSLNTCLKRVNKNRVPKITLDHLAKTVYPVVVFKANDKGGAELISEDFVEEMSLVDQIENGDWRKIEGIADVNRERNSDHTLAGYTVHFTDGDEMFINVED